MSWCRRFRVSASSALSLNPNLSTCELPNIYESAAPVKRGLVRNKGFLSL